MVILLLCDIKGLLYINVTNKKGRFHYMPLIETRAWYMVNIETVTVESTVGIKVPGVVGF